MSARAVWPSAEDPLTAEAAKAVYSVVQRFRAARVPVDARELEQEAWTAVFENAHNYDPDKGPASAYFRVVVRRALGAHVTRLLSPVTLSRGAATNGEGAKFRAAGYENSEEFEKFAQVDRGAALNPENALLARHAGAYRALVRAEMRERIDGVLVGWSEYDRFIAHRITGLDGCRAEKANELAKRIGIDVAIVYRVHARLEKALWADHRLYLLHHRALEHDGEGED